MQVFTMLMIGLVLALPVVLHFYVRRLPVAPHCPSCRAVTSATPVRGDHLRLLPALAATSRGQCARCGWHGRMRWRWAAGVVRHNLR